MRSYSPVGRWLEQRSTFRVYGPSMAWTAFLLIGHVQTWWSMFGMRHQGDWTFIQFTVVLMQPIILFLLATIVLPSMGAPDQDLRANYYAQRKWFFGLVAALLLNSMLKDLMLTGSFPNALNLGFHLSLLTVSILAMAIGSERFHRLLAYFSLLFIALYIFMLFAELA